MRKILSWSGVSAAALLLGASLAQADIVAQGSAGFVEPTLGLYEGSKSFTVYTSDDAGNPQPGPAGSFTYVYTISNNPGCPFGNCIALIGFEIVAPGCLATGYIDDGANPLTPPPSAITPCGGAGDVVKWDWADATGLIVPGSVSDQLIVVSTLGPGSITDTIFGIDGQSARDVEGACVGPVAPEDPNPCTIGFWKNRADEKQGTTQHFPDPQFQQVVDAAAALSGGTFADGAALLAALQKQGKRSMQEKAEQQFAATLLNLAAGDLFPDNQKCKLFESNDLDGTNACVGDATVGDAYDSILADLAAMSFEDAKDCADDLNNGIGIVGIVEGD
jgi:hypothetical protein